MCLIEVSTIMWTMRQKYIKHEITYVGVVKLCRSWQVQSSFKYQLYIVPIQLPWVIVIVNFRGLKYAMKVREAHLFMCLCEYVLIQFKHDNSEFLNGFIHWQIWMFSILQEVVRLCHVGHGWRKQITRYASLGICLTLVLSCCISCSAFFLFFL